MPDFSATFFDYDFVGVHERADELEFLANRPQSDGARILDGCKTRRFTVGEVLVRVGEVGRARYLLTDGWIGVQLESGSTFFKTIDAPSVTGDRLTPRPREIRPVMPSLGIDAG